MTRQRGRPPKEVGGPDVATRAAEPATGNSTRIHLSADGYTPPGAEERYESWVLAEARNLGYRLSCRCLDCRRPLTDEISVRYRRGRVCRQRAGVVL